MRVCSIQREKPLQKLATKLPEERSEERESQFLRVRLLVLIKVGIYVGWENLTVLNVIRLY